MSDVGFIPTARQVREAYEVAHEEVGVPCDITGFDRWLNDIIRRAKAEALQEMIDKSECIPRRDDPEVLLEWDANDEGPPCIDFTCLCGHWQHLCNGPDWITEGIGQVPGVECVKCGTAWSLYRVRITTMIRQVAGREPDRWSVPGVSLTPVNLCSTTSPHQKDRP